MPANAQTITIYPRREDAATGLVRPLRRVLRNAVVMEQGTSIARQAGIVLRESAFIQCFLEDGMVYVPLHEWQKLPDSELEGKWTVDIIAPQTLVVDHLTDHEFDGGTSAQVTTAENTFIRETPGARRIVSLEDNRRGTPRVQHVLLRG